MDPVEILIWLVIGAIAGWLAGQLVRGGGYGLIGDIATVRNPSRCRLRSISNQRLHRRMPAASGRAVGQALR